MWFCGDLFEQLLVFTVKLLQKVFKRYNLRQLAYLSPHLIRDPFLFWFLQSYFTCCYRGGEKESENFRFQFLQPKRDEGGKEKPILLEERSTDIFEETMSKIVTQVDESALHAVIAVAIVNGHLEEVSEVAE